MLGVSTRLVEDLFRIASMGDQSGSWELFLATSTNKHLSFAGETSVYGKVVRIRPRISFQARQLEICITMWEKPPLNVLQKSIEDPSNPIGMRMRAAYYLRQEHSQASESLAIQQTVVDTLAAGLLDPRHGSLMRHEFAYVMGQLRDKRCCPILEKVLGNDTDCIMVRHEAAEALGAIGAERSIPVLRSVKEDNPKLPELSGTCELALNVIEWRVNGEHPDEAPAACACMLNPYSSIDPAPPHPSHATIDFSALGDILCDSSLPLFERYRAMFSLRNRGGKKAVGQLCRALVKDDSSALLRHEVAYVLGQMQHPDSVEALAESLRRTDEHSMVRHESAEALGAIDGRWEDVEQILKEFTKDDDPVVRESCMVALDAADYWKAAPSMEASEAAESFAQAKSDQRLLVNHFNVQLD